MDILHGFGGQLLQGAVGTLALTASSLVLGSFFGAGGCWLQLSSRKPLRILGRAYVTVVRGVPDLLVVFAISFGGSLMLAALTGRYVDVSAYVAAVVALALSFGAYVAEIARGALLSVPTGQREAARTLGLSRAQTLWTVVAPQAMRAALAPFGNQSIVLLKQTSIASIVGCEELMRKAAEASGSTREPFTMYLAAAGIYLLLTGVLGRCLAWAEHRACRHGLT